MPKSRTSRHAHATRQTTLTGEALSTATPSSSSKKPSKDTPERVYTDTVLTIKPEFVALIAKRQKNHEYRKYRLRPTVERLWLYETAPVSALTYVAEVGLPKTPGQVKDSTGIGNDDFDAWKKVSKFGYPVLALHRLREPLASTDMKERFGLAVPQGYYYATKKLVEEIRVEDMEKVF